MNFDFIRTLKYAFRFLLRAKSYTIINLVGLAFSLACCIILLRYIHRELTVDAHCVGPENVIVPLRDIDGNIYPSSTEYMDTAYIKQEQVIERCRVVSLEKDNILYKDKNYEVKVIGADSSFFHFFHYTLQGGKIDLNDPASVFISEKCARRIFGKENPIGKYLQHNYQTVVVKGVLNEPPCKSTWNFDLLFPYQHQDQWGRMDLELLRVLSGIDLDKINSVSNVYKKDNMGNSYRYRFIPWKQLYFDESIEEGFGGMRHGNRSYLTILSGVVFLLLAVGVLNFLNLYMVVMMKRSKEYGIKKVFGLSRFSLFIEIWIENFLLIVMALLGAWLVIEITAGVVEQLMGERLNYTSFDWQLSAGIVFILPLLTAVYPYIRYAYRAPLSSMKQIAVTSHSVQFRLVFLFFQYGITMLLIILSLYFKRHFDFLITTPPGYRTERILEADLHHENQNWGDETQEQRENRWNRMERVSQALDECPYIDFWMYSHGNILKGASYCNIVNDKNQVVSMPVYFVSPEFFKLYELKVTEGEIPETIANINESQMVLNESAMKAFGYAHKEEAFVRGESPLWISVTDGQVTQGGTALMPVVSVIKDFYSGHLKDGMKPMAFIVTDKSAMGKALIFVKEGREKELLSYLKKIEKDIYNTEELSYSWFADNVASLYAHDRKITIIYSVFAFIAIIISCLGLFGISLFDIRQRYREIAIRKVNGAGRMDLYRLLCIKYLKVLALSFLFAAPAAWYIIYCYTSDFVVKASISGDIFLISLFMVSLVSFGTLLWQVNKAARIEPTQIMKSE